MQLDTIQKIAKLNRVSAVDEKGNGGAYHRYLIESIDTDGNYGQAFSTIIQLQNGARLTQDSTPGVIDTDLLEIVRHRLTCFQQGNFSSEYNQQALLHVEEALRWLNKRIEDRHNRNVLGKNLK